MSIEALHKRSTSKALEEDGTPKSFIEFTKKYYRENPPEFTVKKELANRYGVAYFLFNILGQPYVGGWCIIPHLGNPEYSMQWKAFIVFVAVQCFYNWFQCCRKYVNKAEKIDKYSDRSESSGWRFCAVCQYYAPPRSHHCKLCKACILRQDHHCFFAAGCIGIHTSAYFTVMCFWLLVSQALALYWVVQYIHTEFVTWWQLFPPASFCLAAYGAISWFDWLLALYLFLIPVNIVLVSFYFLIELYAATQNQTFHEGSKGIRRFNTGSLISNIKATFGDYMWIRWLVPFYSAPHPSSDGYEWYIKRNQ